MFSFFQTDMHLKLCFKRFSENTQPHNDCTHRFLETRAEVEGIAPALCLDLATACRPVSTEPLAPPGNTKSAKLTTKIQKWWNRVRKYQKRSKKNPTKSDVFFGFPTFFLVSRRNPTRGFYNYPPKTNPTISDFFLVFRRFFVVCRRNPTQGLFAVTDPHARPSTVLKKPHQQNAFSKKKLQ